VIVPPSGSVEPLAEQVIVSPVVAVSGSHDTAGAVGERLVNVSVISFELFESSVPSVAWAVTAVVPGRAREYVVLVPCSAPVRSVADHTYVTASPSTSVDPDAVQVIDSPVGVEVGLQSTVGAVGAVFGGGGGGAAAPQS
jgi:hypothetical protein